MAKPRSQSNLADKVVTFTLRHVPFDGWTLKALEHGAADAGISTDEASALFEHDINKVVAHYSDMMDQQMLKKVAKMKLTEMKIRDQIATCVMTRLNLMAPHREAAQRAASYLTFPTRTALGTKLLYQTVSRIWYAAGDTATDFNFYTKRALLAGVYGSTLVYWFSDFSKDFADTEKFLKRRIENVMMIPKIKGTIKDVCTRYLNPFNFFK